MILIGVYSWATTFGHGYGVREVSFLFRDVTKEYIDNG